MGALRRHRGIAVWLALFALVGHMLAVALCPPPAKHSFIDIPPELAGAYVLCSGGEVPTGDPTPDKSKNPCDMCLAAASLKLLLAIAAIVSLFTLAPARPWHAPSFVLAFKDFLRRDGLQSRAPPLPT